MAKKKQPGKDPSFLFYSQDWFMGTISMTQTQKGCFIDLLAIQHQNGSLDIAIVNKICGGICEDIDVVLTKFKKTADGKFYYNAKLRNVMAERADYKLRQSELAKRRWSKNDVPGQSQPISTRVETEDEDEESNTIASIDAKTYSSLDDLYEN